MPSNNPPTPRALALGTALKEARENRKRTLRDVAAEISRDASELSRWENGKRVPKQTDVAKILGVLRVNGERYEEILSLASDTDASSWLATSLPEQRQQLNALLEFERTAKSFVEVSPLLIPGVLQTTDYVRAIMTAGTVPDDEIATRIAVRVGRRDVITREDPISFVALIGEAALRQIVGSRHVMAAQLRYLLELMELPNIDVRAIPYESGWHPALEGPFVLINSPDSGYVVHLENRRSGMFLHQEPDVESYRQAADLVQQAAMNSKDTVKLVAEIAKGMES